MHCGFCCPPPSLSEARLEKIAASFAGLRPKDPAELDTWRLTLTCDHVVNKVQHHTNPSWIRRVEDCPECEQIRGIVIAEKQPSAPARRSAEQRQLAHKLKEARAEHDLQAKADTASKRMKKLESQLAGLDEIS